MVKSKNKDKKKDNKVPEPVVSEGTDNSDSSESSSMRYMTRGRRYRTCKRTSKKATSNRNTRTRSVSLGPSSNRVKSKKNVKIKRKINTQSTNVGMDEADNNESIDAENSPKREIPLEQSPLVEECKSEFNNENLYGILGLQKTALASEIKKAYYKFALMYHPDKQSDKNDAEKETARRRFQLINRIFLILSDDNKRKAYDRNGIVREETETSSMDWVASFGRISKEEIESFEKEFKGSEEERSSLLELYEKHRGNWDLISEYLMFYSIEDDSRLKEIIAKAASSGEIKKVYPESKAKLIARRKRFQKERREFEASESNAGSSSMNVLVKTIATRNEKRKADVIGDIEAKYCKGRGRKCTRK